MKALNFITQLRPPTLDRLAKRSNSIFARIWRGIRAVVFLDLIVYWAMAIGLILPAILGAGFAFTGGIVAALAVAAVYFVFGIACSATVTVAMRYVGFMAKESRRELTVLWCAFLGITVLFLYLATAFGGAVLAVTGLLSYVIATIVLALIAFWAYPPRAK